MSSDEAAVQRARSPFSRPSVELPVELLSTILANLDWQPFGLLTPSERAVQLANFEATSRVSKRWRAASESFLWRQLEFNADKNGAWPPHVTALGRHSQVAPVKTLWVESVHPLLSDITMLSERCPHVEELKLHGDVLLSLSVVARFTNLRVLILAYVDPFFHVSSSFPLLTTLSFRRVRLNYHPFGRHLLDTKHFPALRHLALLACTWHTNPCFAAHPSPHIPHLSPALLAQLDELLLDVADHASIMSAHVTSYDFSTGPRVAWRVDVETPIAPTTLPIWHDVLPVEHLVVTVRRTDNIGSDKRRRKLLYDVLRVLAGTASARTIVVPAVLWRPEGSTRGDGSLEDRISMWCERRGVAFETYERARLERAPRVGGEVGSRRSGVA